MRLTCFNMFKLIQWYTIVNTRTQHSVPQNLHAPWLLSNDYIPCTLWATLTKTRHIQRPRLKTKEKTVISFCNHNRLFLAQQSTLHDSMHHQLQAHSQIFPQELNCKTSCKWSVHLIQIGSLGKCCKQGQTKAPVEKHFMHCELENRIW